MVEAGAELRPVNHKPFLKEKNSPERRAESVKELKTYLCFYPPIFYFTIKRKFNVFLPS